jgi:hypothetical protein
LDRVGGASQPRPPTPPYVLAVYGGFINVVTDHIWRQTKLTVKARCESNAVNDCREPGEGWPVPPAACSPWCCALFGCSTFIEIFPLLLALKIRPFTRSGYYGLC